MVTDTDVMPNTLQRFVVSTRAFCFLFLRRSFEGSIIALLVLSTGSHQSLDDHKKQSLK